MENEIDYLNEKIQNLEEIILRELEYEIYDDRQDHYLKEIEILKNILKVISNYGLA